MKQLWIAIVTFFYLVLSFEAHACDLCTVYNAVSASGVQGKGLSVGIAEQFTHFGTLKDEGQATANNLGQFLDSSITQIFSGYDFNPRFGLQLTVPVIVRSFRRANTGVAETGSESGVGDMTLHGRFSPYQKYTEHFSFHWGVLGGLKIPTGSTHRLDEELAEGDEDPELPGSGIHGHDLTFGSGSWDGVVGTGVYTRWHRLLGTAELQYSLRSTGAIDYRFANDLHWNVGVGAYPLLRHTYTLAVQAKVSGEHKGLDTLAGVQAEDTGITTVMMGPEFLFTWKYFLSVGLGADIPVMIHNTSLQSVPDYRIRTSIMWRFF